MFSRVRKHWSRWRSEDADESSLIEIIKPFYILLLLLGLFPCSITFPKGKYSKIEQKSIVINTTCTLIMVSSIIIIMAININETSSFSMSDINYLIEIALLIAITIVSYFGIYFYRYLHIKNLNAVALTWTELDNSDAKHLLKQFQFMTWVLILGWLILLVGGFTILSCIYKSGVWLTVSVVLPEMVPSGMVAFYNIIGLMVASLLKNIEHQCEMFADHDKCTKIGFIRVQPKQFWNSVSQLELAYKKALEIKREVNTAFQAVLMIITLQAFHTVLTESHELYRGLIKTGTFKAIDIIRSLHWIIYQTLKMYAISYPGTVIENEEKKIGQALLCVPTESVQLIAEVQHFSSLMSYQETQMTAYGYFALDATLVFNTFVAIATYLVILVQFDT